MEAAVATGVQTGSRSPLTGLRVIDLTSDLSGAYATMLMADLGAEVTKVEPPTGDPKRDDHTFFLALNRNKHSVVIDLEDAESRIAMAQLVANADALVEAFSAETALRYGVDAESLRRMKPSLVHVTLSPFGRDGAMQSTLGNDLIIQALSGSMEVTGEPDRPPVLMGLPVPEQISGVYGVIALLAALERRDAQAGGATVDISMLDVSLGLLSYMANIHFADGSVPRRLGSAHPVIYPYNAFETSDGYLTAAPFTQDFWRKFAQAIGRPDLSDNPRYKTFGDRLRNRFELSQIIDPILRSKTRVEWLAALDAGDVPNGPLNTVGEAIDMPHSIARGMVVPLEGDTTGVRTLGCPFHFDFQDGATFTPTYHAPPEIGAQPEPHTCELPQAPAGDAAASLPLTGIKVVDLTRMFAGPYCTMLLADMGADVVKVEEPRIGDPTRRNLPIVNGESAYFMSVNRGKKSIVLDMKDTAARDKLLELIAESDIVVENFRPGVMARLGLGYESLKKVKPDIILCSISGFGQTGPLREKISFDLVNQSMAGTMALTGSAGQPPVRIGIPIGDLSGGIYATVGVLAALRSRRRSGCGAMVDVALHDVLLSQLGPIGQQYLSDGVEPQAVGSSHRFYAPHGAYAASDGYLALSASSDSQWAYLAAALGIPDLPDDVRFATPESRMQNRDILDDVIGAALGVQTVDHWVSKLNAGGVAAAKICSIAEALRLPIARERGAVFPFFHPKAGKFETVGTALMADGKPWRATLPPPTHGEHDEDLLGVPAAANMTASV